MFENVFNKTAEAQALGTFTVQNGNVMKGTTPLVTWFNDKAVIIGMNARSSFSLPAEHQMFDQLLLELMSKKIGVMYVESVSKFMDPKARFEEFLAGTLDPQSVGMELPIPLINLPELYQTVKGLFDAMFTVPTPPMSPGIDLTLYFNAEQITNIEAWRTNKAKSLTNDVKRKIAIIGQAKAGLLRLVANGNTWRVENDQGHYVSKTRFLDAFKNYVKPHWDKNPTSDEGKLNGRYNRIEVREYSYQYNDTKSIEVYATYLQLGCQSIPRAEVEAMVSKLNAL